MDCINIWWPHKLTHDASLKSPRVDCTNIWWPHKLTHDASLKSPRVVSEKCKGAHIRDTFL